MTESKRLFTGTEARNSNYTERNLVNHEKRIREEAQKQRAKGLEENMLVTPSKPFADLMERVGDAKTRTTDKNNVVKLMGRIQIVDLTNKILPNLQALHKITHKLTGDELYSNRMNTITEISQKIWGKEYEDKDFNKIIDSLKDNDQLEKS